MYRLIRERKCHDQTTQIHILSPASLSFSHDKTYLPVARPLRAVTWQYILSSKMKMMVGTVWALVARKPVVGVSDKASCKPVFSATETSYKKIESSPVASLHVASLHMIFSKNRIPKALIRLRECAGWSAHVLFAKPRRQVCSLRGPCTYDVIICRLQLYVLKGLILLLAVNFSLLWGFCVEVAEEERASCFPF